MFKLSSKSSLQFIGGSGGTVGGKGPSLFKSTHFAVFLHALFAPEATKTPHFEI